jgi:glycosyltransferase involved in cell wall biosynthesis
MLDSVKQAYAAIDSLLFLSKTEPFGLILAEAMASGVPIVGIAGEGGYSDPEYPLVTSDNALLLPPEMPLSRTNPASGSLLVELARSITDLRNLPGSYSAMSLLARKWVSDRFDIQQRAQDLADVYGSALAETGPLHG